MWLCNVVAMFSYANILFAKLLMVTCLRLKQYGIVSDRESVSRMGVVTRYGDMTYLLLLLRSCSCTPQSAKTSCISHEHTYVFYQFTDQKK